MNICNRVKIFESSNYSCLEEQINTWLKENDDMLLVDIKFNTYPLGTYLVYYTAMIIYQ